MSILTQGQGSQTVTTVGWGGKAKKTTITMFTNFGNLTRSIIFRVLTRDSEPK